MSLLEKLIYGGPRPPCKCGRLMAPLKRGYPIFVCRCGVVKVRGIRTGDGSISLSPAASGDIIEWTGFTNVALLPGQMGMNIATGRANVFMDGRVQALMSADEVLPRRSWEIQQAPNLTTAIGKGTANLPTVEGTPAVLEVANVGQFILHAILAVTGSDGGWISPTFADCRRDHNVVFDAILRTGSSIAGIRFWIGLFSADPMGSATPAVHFAGVRFDTSVPDAAWRFVTGDGVGTTVATPTLGIAVNTAYFVRIILVPTGGGVASAIFSMTVISGGGMNDVHQATVTTTLPAATTNLGYVVQARTLENVAKTIAISKISGAVHPQLQG